MPIYTQLSTPSFHYSSCTILLISPFIESLAPQMMYPMHQESYQKDMDNACVHHEEKAVIHELTQGLQMTQQLRLNLHSSEAREFLIHKILSSYDNALFVLRSRDSVGQPPAPARPARSLPESSMSIESPGSKELEFDQPFFGQLGKKRKGSPTLENQVRISSENGLEDDTDDGYNWRKYGQKDIMGAKYPRSYYRCSYRKVQKCLATKQVQRTDDDPTIFEIAYKGEHTCNHGARLASPPPRPPSPEKHEITPTHHDHQLPTTKSSEMLLNLRANLSVNTSDLGEDTILSSFSFPSTSFALLEDDHHQLHFPNHYDDEFLQVYSPPFISPATSESNVFMEWGSSPSLDFLADPADVDLDFEFKNSLF